MARGSGTLTSIFVTPALLRRCKFRSGSRSLTLVGRAEPVKFVAARSGNVYPGVGLTRALMLTRDYLLDVTRLVGSQQHRYYWLVHTLGEIESRLPKQWRRSNLPQDLHPLEDVWACDTEADGWSITAVQTCALDDPSEAKLPQQWYRREVGVRVRMLPQAGTTVYTAQTPLVVGKKGDEQGRRPDVKGQRRFFRQRNGNPKSIRVIYSLRSPAT